MCVWVLCAVCVCVLDDIPCCVCVTHVCVCVTHRRVGQVPDRQLGPGRPGRQQVLIYAQSEVTRAIMLDDSPYLPHRLRSLTSDFGLNWQPLTAPACWRGSRLAVGQTVILLALPRRLY